jgi:VWFA-related protein
MDMAQSDNPAWRTILRLSLIAVIVWRTLSPLYGQQATIRADVDLVVVPTSVKDAAGRFVYDLKEEAFSIFEDGRRQQIQQFSIDPAPLSTVALVDSGIGGTSLRRFAAATVALSSAFIPMDETEAYRFDKFVTRLSDFTTNSEAFEKSLTVIHRIAEQPNQGPHTWTLFPGRGPRWLRLLLDYSTETRLLNDAIVAAATDLEKRPPTNRRSIIVISDGQSVKDTSSFQDVRNRLVKDEIQVYAVTVSLPILDAATSSLQAYANATGGDVYSGRTTTGMQDAFARITEQARHEYVLSYVSNNEVTGSLPVQRKIEVKTVRPGLKLHHRSEYLQYPRHT